MNIDIDLCDNSGQGAQKCGRLIIYMRFDIKYSILRKKSSKSTGQCTIRVTIKRIGKIKKVNAQIRLSSEKVGLNPLCESRFCNKE